MILYYINSLNNRSQNGSLTADLSKRKKKLNKLLRLFFSNCYYYLFLLNFSILFYFIHKNLVKKNCSIEICFWKKHSQNKYYCVFFIFEHDHACEYAPDFVFFPYPYKWLFDTANLVPCQRRFLNWLQFYKSMTVHYRKKKCRKRKKKYQHKWFRILHDLSRKFVSCASYYIMKTIVKCWKKKA